MRTLIRAMESPHNPARPGRPKKILVRNREIQFFLRGVLQDLDIEIDYVPALPLIDEVFRGLSEFMSNAPSELPESYANPLNDIAEEIWKDAPWRSLDEEKIIAVEVNSTDPCTLYVSILGLQGLEFGILMYRSLDSLISFRRKVLTINDSSKAMEEAFLEQDCFFLTFDVPDQQVENIVPMLGARLAIAPADDPVPSFGNLHPLEGMRPVLYEEEAETVFLVLSALHRFFRNHLSSLGIDVFPKKTGRYQIPSLSDGYKITVKVATLPDVANELSEMTSLLVGDREEDNEDGTLLPILRNDVMPENAFYSLGAMPWDVVEILRQTAQVYQAAEAKIPQKSDGLPIILIQTSRPKALAMIEELQAAGGMKAICFNPGEDPYMGQRYDLGILQTSDSTMHLFGEFGESDPVHIQARKKWDQRCKQTKGYCGLVIARGLTGKARGNPGLEDMMALFEVRSLSSKELGLGTLQLMPQFEF